MGNGQFERVATSITSKSSSDQIILQDVNSDGLTDVIKTLGTSGFFTYLTRPGTAYTSDSYTSFNYTGSVLVPTDINSRNYFHQLVALKDGKVTRYSYPRNDTKEKQLTGAVNSYGVIDKIHYMMLMKQITIIPKVMVQFTRLRIFMVLTPYRLAGNST
jgi:hypothetical protein